MLQKIRDSLQAQRWFGITVLAAIAVVFVAWGAYGIVDVGFGGGNYAAKVNGEKIPVEEANRVWMEQQTQWQQAFGGEIPEERKRALQDEVLDGLITRSLLDERTHEAGYRVSDAQLKRQIEREPAFQVDGKYDAQLAKARLAQIGLSVGAYTSDLRRTMQRSQIANALAASSFVTAQDLRRAIELEDEQREVRHAILPPEKFAPEAPVDDAAIRKYYDEHRDEYMTPESVRLQFAELRLEQLAPQVVVSDAELREEYEKNRERYVQPEKRRARHILIQAGDPKDDAAALKKAESLLADARAGKDFAELARKNSQDAGSAAQGGDLGWAERSSFVGPFSDALFAMQPGEIRGPVKTEFGYHVIKLEEIEGGKTRSFEEALPELQAQARRDRAGDLFGDRIEQIQLAIEAGGADLAKLAQQFGMQLGEVAEFTRLGGGAPLGVNADLRDTVFGDTVLTQRKIGGPVALGEDRFVIVKVLDHRRPAAKPIEQVREEIVAAVRQERGSEAARAAAQAAVARLERGESLDAIAKELGVTVEPARFIGRLDPAVPAQVREAAFSGQRPTAAAPVRRAIPLDQGGAAIVMVTQARPGDAQNNAQLRAQRVQDLSGRRGSGDITAYVQELRRTADIDRNPKAFE
jgi:peptidyl-prolyl cis-trans isomerase D